MMPYLRGKEHCRKVGVNDKLPLLRLHAHDERVTRDASVVDQHINATPLLNCLLDEPACMPHSMSKCLPVAYKQPCHRRARKAS